MVEIKFKNMETYNSQQSIVKFLSGVKYSFAPINDYDNTQFYCMIKCAEKDYAFEWFYQVFKKWGAKRKEIKYFEYPLSLTVCSCLAERNEIPIVFTREEVQNIINDVPENYIGGKTL